MEGQGQGRVVGMAPNTPSSEKAASRARCRGRDKMMVMVIIAGGKRYACHPNIRLAQPLAKLLSNEPASSDSDSSLLSCGGGSSGSPASRDRVRVRGSDDASMLKCQHEVSALDAGTMDRELNRRGLHYA